MDDVQSLEPSLMTLIDDVQSLEPSKKLPGWVKWIWEFNDVIHEVSLDQINSAELDRYSSKQMRLILAFVPDQDRQLNLWPHSEIFS